MNALLREPSPLPPGIYLDEPEASYHAPRLGVLSCSAIKQLLRSPRHYQHWLAQESEPSAAQRFGRAFHMALLEPARFKAFYCTLPADAPRRPSITQLNAKKPSDETVEAIAWWAEFERTGRTMLSQADMERIDEMLVSVHSHPWASLLIQGGNSEVTLRWQDEATGLECKARADYYRDEPKRYVLDVKTCADASPEGFAKAVHNFGYHLQHAHYADGFRSLGLPLHGYYLLAVESEAPYVCQPYYLDAEAEGKGFALRNAGASTLKRCMETGKFPGYSDDIAQLCLPPWAVKINQEQDA